MDLTYRPIALLAAWPTENASAASNLVELAWTWLIPLFLLLSASALIVFGFVRSNHRGACTSRMLGLFLFFVGLVSLADAFNAQATLAPLVVGLKACSALAGFLALICMVRRLWQATFEPDTTDLHNQLGAELERRTQIEQKQQELLSQMSQTQKLESLGVLAGGIAHDFNNLLTSVLGYADLARQDMPQNSKAREHLNEAMRGATRAAELTNQLLAYSGKGKFVVERANLTHLVRSMSRLVEVSISKKVKLQYQLDEKPGTIEADLAQIRQVVLNLITNASDAIGDAPGTLRVTTGTQYLSAAEVDTCVVKEQQQPGSYVFVEVADSGVGMTPETLAKIFDPFFTTKVTGRGLGLSALIGIVRGHHGLLKVVSQPGLGTTFTVYFPQVDAPAMPLEDLGASVTTGWRGGGTVLVADDEDSVLAVASAMLQRMGFEVLTALDGEEAHQLYLQHQEDIRLVVLDMTMPNWDGLQTFNALRTIQPNLRVILSSGYSQTSAVTRFTEAGFAGFLQKPYRFKHFQEVVRHVLERPQSFGSKSNLVSTPT